MGRLIPLTRGKFAIVDESDFAELARYSWYAFESRGTFYAARKAGLADTDYRYREVIFMHKQILNIESLVDHKDRDGLNNTRVNLRPATYSQNNANRSSRKGSSSQYLGVVWDKSRKLWQAKLTYQGTTYQLGRFNSEEAAAAAYNQKALEVFGEFANANLLRIGG